MLMFQHLRACLWLLVITVVLCCVAYPLVLLGIGKAIFPRQAAGSLIERDGKTVGSRLIAQPFTDPKYFQPRPSAASPSYNAAGSGASNYAANNYLLRDRVARQLGPIVRYAGRWTRSLSATISSAGSSKTSSMANRASWPSGQRLHSGVVQPWLHDWVKADKLNAAYVADWEAKHTADVDKWKSENTFDPDKPEDLAAGIAVPFFTSFSSDHPGTFPGVAEYEKDGKTAKTIGPVKEGGDIQGLFFDMWLCDHPDADLDKVPADMVTASGSGLDPHITLDNAVWQLNNLPIAASWAKSSGGDEGKVREEIRKILQDKSSAPLGKLIGVPLVNVLEINLALEDHFSEIRRGEVSVAVGVAELAASHQFHSDVGGRGLRVPPSFELELIGLVDHAYMVPAAHPALARQTTLQVSSRTLPWQRLAPVGTSMAVFGSKRERLALLEEFHAG